MVVNEPLDIERPDALLAYLRTAGHLRPDECPELRTLAGGVSSRTVLVTRADGEAWVLKQSLPKLRVEVDWYSDPARIHAEGNGIRWLTRLAPAGTIPSLVFEDHRHHLLAMQAVPQPHRNWKALLLAGALDLAHVRQFGRLLGAIHRRSWERRTEIADAFDDRSVFESLRVEPYYAYTGSQVPEGAGFLLELIASVRARRYTLVHGDYSPKNILVHSGRLVLLDHEVIHFGDPAFDLGFSIAHLLSKAHHVQPKRDAFLGAVEVYWRTYREEIGDAGWADGVEPHAVRHTIGCLLARVAGRSPLEYLSRDERGRQRAAAIALMRDTPRSVPGLVAAFNREL